MPIRRFSQQGAVVGTLRGRDIAQRVEVIEYRLIGDNHAHLLGFLGKQELLDQILFSIRLSDELSLGDDHAHRTLRQVDQFPIDHDAHGHVSVSIRPRPDELVRAPLDQLDRLALSHHGDRFLNLDPRDQCLQEPQCQQVLRAQAGKIGFPQLITVPSHGHRVGTRRRSGTGLKIVAQRRSNHESKHQQDAECNQQ